MRIMNKFKLVVFYLLLGMGAGATASATLFPDLQTYSEALIDYLDLQTGTLVVDEIAYKLPGSTPVLRSDGTPVARQSLRPGMVVRLYVDRGALEAGDLPLKVKGIELVHDGDSE